MESDGAQRKQRIAAKASLARLAQPAWSVRAGVERDAVLRSSIA